ncbi:Brassinosteroid-responsive RING protein 1, partial [Cucurbita argyrosperma subsp. sororia]
MNRRVIPFLFAVPQTQPESESSLSPTAMGYPVGYADVFFSNAFLHLLVFLGYIRSLIISLYRILGLPDFLESSVVWPQNPTPIIDDHSVLPIRIEEFFPMVKFSDIFDAAGAGFPPECCAVCLCEFQDDEEVRFLKNCKHIFHKECLDGWMIRDQRSCPLCRTLIVPEESIPPLVDFPGCSEFSGDYS